MRRVSLVAWAIVLCVSALPAQKRDKAPPRPKMPAAADTNDANAYYTFGMMHLRSEPRDAANAFYWATRIAPAWPEPYYARRTALHLENPDMLVRYWNGDRSVLESKETQAIDSLRLEAMIRNPFLNRVTFDRMLADEVIATMSSGMTVLSEAASGDPADLGNLAFTEGRFEDAAKYFGEALRKDPTNLGTRDLRAQAFYLVSRFDSSTSELTQLLAAMRKVDDRQLVVAYNSKALLEFALSRAYVQLADFDNARKALGRALEEDLSFYMAHVELAELALRQSDTTTALSELAIATDIRGGDASVRLRYGLVLSGVKRLDDAAAQYRLSIKAEPYFALPYFYLARTLESQQRAPEAVIEYRAFVSHAAKNQSEVALANDRLAALSPPRQASKTRGQ